MRSHRSYLEEIEQSVEHLVQKKVGKLRAWAHFMTRNSKGDRKRIRIFSWGV